MQLGNVPPARAALGVCSRLALLAWVLLISARPGQAAELQQDALQLRPDAVGPMSVSVAELDRGLCTTGAPPVPLVEITIARSQELFFSGDLNCSALVAAYIQRIAAFDGRTQLNAVRALNPAAATEAAQLDVRLVAVRRAAQAAGGAPPAGAALPPLFCTPVLVKNNVDVAGVATTAGSLALADNFPLQDAGVIARLKAAGAIVLGVANLGELAFFPSFCVSSAGGTVRNPYHLHHSPAGSSGGTAAGVAANLGMVGVGTDTGNSVRGPASHCGLVGLRPTIGLVGRSGVVPLRWDRDTLGTLTRSVADAAALLGGMTGPDPLDNMTHLLTNLSSLPASYMEFLTPEGLQGVKLGVVTQIAQISGMHSAIKALWEQALQDLTAAGAVLVHDFRIEGNSLGQEWDPNRGGEGPALGHWHAGGKWQDLWACQAMRTSMDEFLAGGNTSRRVHSLRELYSFGLHHPLADEDLRAALRTAPPAPASTRAASPTAGASSTADARVSPGGASAGCGCGALWDDPCRLEFRSRLVASMDSRQALAIIHPTWGQRPLLVGDPGDGYYDGNNSPFISPHTGTPSITVPMGLAAGLPAGLSFLGRPFDEGSLLRVAHAYEQATLHRQPPPLFKECTDPPPAGRPLEQSQIAAAGR